MSSYIAKRLLLLLPILAGLSVVIFYYIHLVPGDPVAGLLGQGSSPALVAELRHRFGLDKPLPEQYIKWLGGLLRHDLGITFVSRQPITPLLVGRIPATLQLTAGGLVAALLIGLPAGLAAGSLKDTKFDRAVSSLALAGLSTPIFWLGTLMGLVFAVRLGWLPSQGYEPFLESPGTSMQLMILPSVTLGMALAPYLARMTRAAIIETNQEQFVKFAQAKGLRTWRIFWRYSIRNAILPVLVVIGLQIGELLSGQVVVEELFNWPGVGRLLVQGVIDRDYYLVQAIVLVMAVMFVLLNLAAEIAQASLDPRIRLR